ncbi:MAG TPA: alpha-L-fucosidase [Candidatus Limnocylindrales bacterium]|nr:alpha-L-fucosidase [Candidatus Limnocylindrales bacterium]
MTLRRAALLLAISVAVAQELPRPDRMGVVNTGPYDYGVMGPPATPAIVAAAGKAVDKRLPPGPFQPTWESIEKNYRPPSWFDGAGFGIFIHWGIFAVPAHHNEWYEKHMYGAEAQWHTAHFGPPEQFGYKDFIPKFTAAKFDAAAWAALFKNAGARIVIGMGEHHDNFAEWNSDVTPFNSVKMGPHRDLIGELSAAVHRQGLKFGIANHGVENFTFVNPPADLRDRLKAAHADLYDPAWAAFYNVADRSDAAMTRFLTDWVNRNLELIDKYQPDLLWWDNGANLRLLDPLKLFIAAYYYNRARQWNREVSLATKYVAMAPGNDDRHLIGSILDFEKVGTRSPAAIRPGQWMVDDPIGSNSWGYVEDLHLVSPASIIAKLVDTASKGGVFFLNVSPMADGAIPEAQQQILMKVGTWLQTNGEAIYGARAYSKFADGAIHFTAKSANVFAIFANWPSEGALKLAISTPISGATLLGSSEPLKVTQDVNGAEIRLPAKPQGDGRWSVKLTSTVDR